MRRARLIWLAIVLLLVACGSDSRKRVPCIDGDCPTGETCSADSVCVADEDAGVPDAGTDAAPGDAAGGADTGAGGAASEAGAPDVGESELVITLVGNGSVAVDRAAACLESPCQYPVASGSVLQLTAKPGADSRFTGWSGTCRGTDAKTTVSVAGSLECVATFAVQRTVSLDVAASGGGSVTTSPDLDCTLLGCNGQVDDHSSVTLIATPDAGFRFKGWTGSPECEGGAEATLPLEVTEDVACTAQFAAEYTVSVSALGAAATVSVTSGSCVATVCSADAGSSASFSAAALAGYRFTGWSGNSLCTGTVNPLQVANIASDIACIANYAARFSVTGLVGGGLAGNVVATSPSANAVCVGNTCTVDSGTSTTLVAPTIAGRRLTGWTGVGCDASGQSGNGLAVTPKSGSLTCTANYALGVAVTGTVVGATGTVAAASASPGAACTAGACSIDAGGSVTLTAPNLAPGFRFKGWTGDPGCTGAALTLALASVTSSKACTANYVAQFTIAAKASAGGTVAAAIAGNACAANSCTVDLGTSVALSATADTANGYHFSGWTGANCTPAGTDSLTLSNVSATCTATFALNTFTIAATAGANGSVTATRNDTTTACAGASCNVNFGTSVSLLATAALHFHFLAWSGAGCTPTGSATLTLKNVNAKCAAAFTADTFTASVSAAPSGSGSVGISCPAANCVVVPYGQIVNVTAAPSAGWSFSGWSANCNGGTASPNAVTITGATACVATFRPTVVASVSPASAGTITASGAPNGVCVNGSPASCIVDLGGSVTLTATAANDAVFTGWTGDCTVKTAATTLSAVNTPKTCTANFYQLWAQATGSANPDGMTNVLALADGTVVGLGVENVARLNQLALVDLNADTGKLARAQLFSDTGKTGAFAALGLSATANQKNVIALGAHRSANATLPFLHNEQLPAWDFEYTYSNGGAASGTGGEVITTLDGGYAFAVGLADPKLGVMAHLTKVDVSGKPQFDVQFCAADANGGCLATQPFDVMQDATAKYFTVLSQVANANVEILLTFLDETGKILGSTRYSDKGADVHATQLVAGSAADTFLVVGWRANASTAPSDAFYAELSRAGKAPAFAVSLGSANADEQLLSVVRTATGYALAGVFSDAKLGNEAWLVQSTSAGAITSQQAYSGSGDERANSITTVPAGGFALGGATTTWGAGLSDMWTLRVDANGALTFNAASAATRYATSFASAAMPTLSNSAVTLVTLGSVATAGIPAVTVSTAGFTQFAEAP